jgi:GalNAc-alpha-(1->4)-GalNAc-alpha-(1->3)-diNAcBac-PP-undecaprenol alpha-1,4-N-acetyl-D-galactosaminyltransferase
MSKKQSIAFLSFNLTSGGAERVFSNLANEFSADYPVSMITIEKCTPFYELDQRVQRWDCGLSIAKKGPVSRYFSYITTAIKLRKLIKEKKIDLVVSASPTVNVFAILGCMGTNTKCVISEVNNPIVDPPNLFWKTWRDLLYNKSDCLISQTQSSKDFFSKIMDNNKIVVLPNPLNPEFQSQRVLPIKRPDNKTILTVGRLDSNKAQDILIRAFANIPHKDWTVKLLGDGVEMESLKQLSEALGVGEQVHFAGRQSNVADYYKEADIFVFTSRSEGLPNALIEAQYFGLPCISTDCPFGPSEIIEDGTNGYLIEVDSVEQLEEKLVRLINEPGVRDTFSENSIKASKKYEMGSVKKQWEELFNSLA